MHYFSTLHSLFLTSYLNLALFLPEGVPHTKDSVVGLGLIDVALLDLRGAQPLTTADKDKFKYLLYGGILGGNVYFTWKISTKGYMLISIYE